MSLELISRSTDLKRLRDEGYELEIKASYLLMHSVPYVNSNNEIKLGTLVSTLELAGDKTVRPADHVTFFTGDYPCNKDGTEITAIKHSSATQTLAPDVVVKHSFSNKPAAGYSDYYDKMTRYAEIISGPARSIDPNVSPRTFKVIESQGEDSVFSYLDTATSRAGIKAMSDKLAALRIGIVGLGGTGSYVLDFVAKTPVREIHLFDGDSLYSHNAFRSPGAAGLDELRSTPKKVDYYRDLFSRMRSGIVAHDRYINASNVNELRTLDFIFLCLDKNEVKNLILEKLEEWQTSFIDVGMDVLSLEDTQALIAVLRVTTSTPTKRDHVRRRMSLSDGEDGGEYDRNIQIVELNALNAALAVIKWKNLMGFYQDLENEHHSTYSLNVNMLRSEDQVP
jgi:tRNA A37 threonylcarbamoyladenosine dehydratase